VDELYEHGTLFLFTAEAPALQLFKAISQSDDSAQQQQQQQHTASTEAFSDTPGNHAAIQHDVIFHCTSPAAVTNHWCSGARLLLLQSAMCCKCDSTCVHSGDSAVCYAQLPCACGSTCTTTTISELAHRHCCLLTLHMCL
jgi:hypothetical protein